MTSRNPITALLVAIILSVFSIVTQCSITSTSGLLPPIFVLNETSPALPPLAFTNNVTRFATLAAPLYGNVAAGDVWVFPSSANDLGARQMSCECFDPGNQCCIAESSDVAPFCMPSGSTCCGNTFCVEGESCCGEFCCAAVSLTFPYPSVFVDIWLSSHSAIRRPGFLTFANNQNTVCNLNIALGTSGCCPVGSLCSGPVICYDYASSNCSGKASPLPQCCPARAPYCRDFKPYGLGCYGSSTTASSASSLQTMTAAGTSNVFASSVGAGSTSKTTGVGSETGNTTSALKSVTSLATATAAVRTSSGSVKETNTVSSASTSTTSAMTTSSSTSTSSAQSTSATTSTSSTSSFVALCYDPAAKSHSPCPTTTAITSASASPSTADFNPPGASIVKSQAGKLRIPLLGPLRDLYRSSHQRVINNGNSTDLIVSLFAIFVLFIYIPLISIHLLRIWRNDKVPCFSRSTMRLDILFLLLVAVAFIAHIRSPCVSDRRMPVTPCLVIFPIGIILGIIRLSLSHLPKEIKETKEVQEAIVKTWLKDKGYTDMQVRNIIAGPHRDDLEPDSDLDVNLNLDLQTEKLKDAITVVQGSAKPLLEKKVVGKGQISIVKGSARPWVKGKRTHSLWEAKARARSGAGAVEGGDEIVEGDGMPGEVEGGALLA
ncbi:hypothetical protein BDR22DRAFT_272021 [Usnea florida]